MGSVPPPEARSGSGGGRRRQARVAGVQALYRAEVVGDPVKEVAADLAADATMREDVREYAARLAGHVGEHGAEIDRILETALTHWDLKRLAVLDRCVLRIATAELLYEPQLPTEVVLDEAIEIAKRFGTGDSGRFVNGVLDRVARDHRPQEQA